MVLSLARICDDIVVAVPYDPGSVDHGRSCLNVMTIAHQSVLFFAYLLLVGCSSKQSRVEAYGSARFARDVLEYRETGKLHEAIQGRFKPDSVSTYLRGVLLIYSDTEHYREGIYVDEDSVEGWGGSGMAITKWHKKIGWVRIKKREATN